MTNILQQEVIRLVDADWLPETSSEDFQRRLAQYLNDLIRNDFEKLVHILYRVDVSEKKLRETLSAACGADAGNVIAALIIERQAEKIKTRERYRSDNRDIPEEDRW